MSQSSYKINDLGLSKSRSQSSITAVNDNSMVIGSKSSAGEPYWFLWTPSEEVKIKVIRAKSINNLGDIVGNGLESKPNGLPYNNVVVVAYIYKNHKLIKLPVLANTVLSDACSINDCGDVAGIIQTSKPLQRRACVWSEGKLKLLKLTAGFLSSEATAINNRGQVAGCRKRRHNSSVISEAILWQNNEEIPLGPFAENRESIATGINDSGQIIGCSFDTGEHLEKIDKHEFVWTDGHIKNLPGLARGKGSFSTANSINNQGQIVGNSWVRENHLHACLWQQESVVDLNDLIPKNSGWTLISAQSINDQGQIACNGIYQGHIHAVLLMPQLSTDSHGY